MQGAVVPNSMPLTGMGCLLHALPLTQRLLPPPDGRGTPGTLSASGFLLVVAALASVYAANGDGIVDVAALLLGVAGVAAFVGGR